MPDLASHTNQAKRNCDFLGQCKSKQDIRTSFPEWYITIQFYACLHIVEAIFAITDEHYDKHTTRNQLLWFRKKEFDTDFAAKYNDLFNLSHRARYLNDRKKQISPGDLQSCDDHFSYIIGYAKLKHKISIE